MKKRIDYGGGDRGGSGAAAAAAAAAVQDAAHDAGVGGSGNGGGNNDDEDHQDPDSDASISWEEFIGTTTDLVPQLLGMFDELARAANNNNNNNNHDHQHQVTTAGLQKRLSLVQKRMSRVYDMPSLLISSNSGNSAMNNEEDGDTAAEDGDDEDVEEETMGISPTTTLRCSGSSSRRRRNGTSQQPQKLLQQQQQQQQQQQNSNISRPVSGSSICSTSSSGSSTTSSSSSSCISSCDSSHYNNNSPRHHHHHHHRRCCNRQGSNASATSTATTTTGGGGDGGGGVGGATNPYLASVESLADTCASSQGSGDSGCITTISETEGQHHHHHHHHHHHMLINGGAGDDGGGDNHDTKNNSGIGGGGGNSNNNDNNNGKSSSSSSNSSLATTSQHTVVERVLQEIVKTEADYVEHLRQVIQGYLIIWRNDSIALISDRDLDGLFSNIEDIFEFNRSFLSALGNCGLDPIAVANTFIEHNSGFEVYTEYCTNYPRTVEILTKLMGQEETARAFGERQAALGHRLPLGAYLLKPVQRILKYHLLFENLSKEFEADEDSPTRTAIECALATMTGIARHINAMKRKHEHAVRVQEIQSLLEGWTGPDLTQSGELIAEGSFRLRGAKAPRHAFLFDKMLLLAKKREDGHLVYKTHILCSNLTLMESIPGEPLSFNVIPFDNSQIQYTLQARNLEIKREWTLQIKNVILENYSAVIPSHARELVLQIGQKTEDDALVPVDRSFIKKSWEYSSTRKADRDRRKTDIGFKQKLRKGRKSDVSLSTADNSPTCSRKNQSTESISQYGSRDNNLNRNSEARASKIKDRFTNWRRKSEPGFQSYITMQPSDNEEPDNKNSSITATDETPSTSLSSNAAGSLATSTPIEEKETKEAVQSQSEPATPHPQSDEAIVGSILMQSEEFRRRLRQHRRYESSDDDNENENSTPRSKSRFNRREQCFVRAVHAYNQRSFRSQYDSFRNVDSPLQRQNSTPIVKSPQRKEKLPSDSGYKKPNFVTESKLIRTALRIRESCDSEEDDAVENKQTFMNETCGKNIQPNHDLRSDANANEVKNNEKDNYGNYDNLQPVWQNCLEKGPENSEKAAVWLTKLCVGLPDQPQKCGSLPRSFQMTDGVQPPQQQPTKSRFLQRDGKSMTDRPFTIASDKPAEINLEDMERYTTNCKSSNRIAKFPLTGASSSSTFFCSLDESSFIDADSVSRTSLANNTYVHPDHKIYRANNGTTNKETSPSVSNTYLSVSNLTRVLSKASSRLQVLKSSQSSETLDCSEQISPNRSFLSKFHNSNSNCSSNSNSNSSSNSNNSNNAKQSNKTGSLPYHKQGSSTLGARIAQSDYADPASLRRPKNIEPSPVESTDDSFYERSFETIENYVDAEDASRDSAIFSDNDDILHSKVPPPVPNKRKVKRVASEKPAITEKPAHLKLKTKVVRCKAPKVTKEEKVLEKNIKKDEDVSAGQSQIGWVKKMVGQLQGQMDT